MMFKAILHSPLRVLFLSWLFLTDEDPSFQQGLFIDLSDKERMDALLVEEDDGDASLSEQDEELPFEDGDPLRGG